MLRLVKQIVQEQPPFLHLNPIIRNDSSQFTAFFFSSWAASKLRNKSPKIEEPVLDFFHSYGFNDAQIKRFIYKSPSVRSTMTVKPKLEHLLTFGFSPSELVSMICSDPNILSASLKERIEPNLSLLEATLGSKAQVIEIISRSALLLPKNLEKHMIPIMEQLKENGMPLDKVIRLFVISPCMLAKDPNLIIETVRKLKALGMSPFTASFLSGMHIMLMLKKETWERKMEFYQSFGFSEKDVISAFARQPTCMSKPEEKIKKQMEFFMKKLEWDLAMILRWPVVLSLSLEKRIIPRCAVLNVLAKNRFWNGKPKLYSLFTMSEKDFEERFVKKYQNELPEVTDAYQGKIDFVGFESREAESDKS